VLQHIVDDIHAHTDHITTGEVGYPYLLRALMQAGRSDVVLATLERKDPPSYGAQIAAGATSLTESWSGTARSSQDHFMLGGAEEWFYRGFGGIGFDMSRKMDERITVRPALVEGIAWVKCNYKSVMGEIRSEWRQVSGATSIDITVPPKATARLILPLRMATKDLARKPAKAGGPQLKEVRRDAEGVVYRATAGLYHFREAE
jgi:hypothetical protein